MRVDVAVLPGDGIGPEVTREAVRVLGAVAETSDVSFEREEHPIGGAGIEEHGTPLPEETLDACRAADAVLLGAVGGPEWNEADPGPEAGLLELRRRLGVFVNLRPVRTYPVSEQLSPVKAGRLADVDLLFVRELSAGLYAGEGEIKGAAPGSREAYDAMLYDETEIRAVVDVALRRAGQRSGRLTSVDKANVLACSRLWRRIVDERAEASKAASPEFEHRLVDSFAMDLIRDPQAYDVVVTSNLFGDVLSDLAANLAGSIGFLPSASLPRGGPGIFEPVHGSAPDIAGTGQASPVGAILSAAMLLDDLGLEEEARRVRDAVDGALQSDQPIRGQVGSVVVEEIHHGQAGEEVREQPPTEPSAGTEPSCPSGNRGAQNPADRPTDGSLSSGVLRRIFGSVQQERLNRRSPMSHHPFQPQGGRCRR